MKRLINAKIIDICCSIRSLPAGCKVSEKVSDQILPSAGQNGLHVALDVKSHYEIIHDQ